MATEPQPKLIKCLKCSGTGYGPTRQRYAADRPKCVACGGNGRVPSDQQPKRQRKPPPPPPPPKTPPRFDRNHKMKNIGKMKFSEYRHPIAGFESTLDFMCLRLDGGIRQAVIMADYGPLGDERSHALLELYEQCKSPAKFELEQHCRLVKLKPSEFVGMVVSGMSQFRLDYESLIVAQRMPDLLDKSFDFAADQIVGWNDRHELMKASGLHLAPKAAVVIDNRDQRSQTAIVGSPLPSFEDTLGEFEQVGQRRLPPSTAEVVDTDFIVKETADVTVSTRDQAAEERPDAAA